METSSRPLGCDHFMMFSALPPPRRHHHPQELALHERAVRRHQVGVRHHGHGGHLPPDLLEVAGVVLQVQHLDRDGLAQGDALRAVNLGGDAAPDLLLHRAIGRARGVLHFRGGLEERAVPAQRRGAAGGQHLRRAEAARAGNAETNDAEGRRRDPPEKGARGWRAPPC